MPDLVERPYLSSVAVVRRHLGPGWDDEISVVDLGEIDGHPAVRIICDGALAFKQARFNLTPFVRNGEDDWVQSAAAGKASEQFEMTLLEPRADEYPEQLVDWFEEPSS